MNNRYQTIKRGTPYKSGFIERISPKIKGKKVCKRHSLTYSDCCNRCGEQIVPHGYAKFTALGGYDSEKERALKYMKKGRIYRVEGGVIGRSSSRLKLAGIVGEHNSSLFACDIFKLPLAHDYIP